MRLALSVAPVIAKPVHSDEAVVENSLCALHSPLGLVWRGKLDQCPLWVILEGNLQVNDGAKLAEMFIEFADVVELCRNLPNQQLGVQREWGSFVVALVVGFVEVGFVKPRFLGGKASIMRHSWSLPRVRLHNDPHAVVWDLVSRWLVYLPHCEANQVGSLGVNPMAVDRPGGIGDAGSLRVVHICLIVVRREVWH